MRPDGAGRLMLQMDDADATVGAETDPSPALPAAQDLVRRAALVLPGIAGIRPEAARIATRPIPADGYSAVGPLPGVTGHYAVVTHSGVTLAAFLGQAVAEEIVRGRTVPELESFRPSRFGR
jgi:glycine/D-amino acid oxidase-like deaminating enzyme